MIEDGLRVVFFTVVVRYDLDSKGKCLVHCILVEFILNFFNFDKKDVAHQTYNATRTPSILLKNKNVQT